MSRFIVSLSVIAITLHESVAENCLQELPMSQLLRIKKSLQELTCDVNECSSGREQTTTSDLQARSRESGTGEIPFVEANGALPLTGVKLGYVLCLLRVIRRGGSIGSADLPLI